MLVMLLLPSAPGYCLCIELAAFLQNSKVAAYSGIDFEVGVSMGSFLD